jgi:DNA-binding NarL/FixJ family response regulator
VNALNVSEVGLLVTAAQVALDRNVLRNADLRTRLMVEFHDAARLMEQLADWGIVTRIDHPSQTCMVLISPRHEKVVTHLITQRQGVPPVPNPLGKVAHRGLTDSWRQILDLIAEGDSNPEIARKVHLQLSTVKTHVRNMRHHYGARTQAHLVSIAYRYRLLPNPHRASGKDGEQ